MNRNIIIVILMITSLSCINGQSVEELILQAKEYNPGLKAMKLDYDAALQKADQVTDWPDPQVNIGIGVLPIETRLGAQRFKLGVSQMIPWKGSLNAKSNAINAMAEVKSYADEVKEIDIEYSIRNTYATLQFLESTKSIINERLKVLDALEQLSKSAVRAGKGKLSNVLFTLRKREFLESDLKLIDKKIEQPTVMLNRWSGKPLGTKIKVGEVDEILVNKEQLLEYAQEGHPQYRILEKQKAVSDAKVSLIQYDSKPKIGIGLDYSFIDGRNDVDIPGNGRDVLMPMGSISIPIHKGRYSAIRQEEVIKKQALDRKSEEFHDIYAAEIEIAYSIIEYNNQVVVKYESLKEITNETLKLMRTEYASEGTRFEELLRLEMELIDYDLEILKAGYERRLAMAVLYKFD